jgi:DEAD/DEAH box helicase domain-containing protein
MFDFADEEEDEKPKKIGYFDLESQRSADEVGWTNKDLMFMSIGVLYVEPEGRYKIFTEDKVGYLLREMFSCDFIVGYNLLGFDYDVLSYYCDEDQDLWSLPTVDMMLDVNDALDRKKSLGLGNVAEATLGYGKTEGDPTIVFDWYKQGEIKKIAKYCKGDVRVTKETYNYGVENGHIFYINQNGAKTPVENIEWTKRLGKTE